MRNAIYFAFEQSEQTARKSIGASICIGSWQLNRQLMDVQIKKMSYQLLFITIKLQSRYKKSQKTFKD